MASVAAHMLDMAMRLRVKARLWRGSDVAKARRVLAGGRLPVPEGVAFTQAVLGGVAGEWVRPIAGGACPTLLYLHGGGYFACSPQTHRPITAGFARQGFAVFVPDYRLAPEHPFPAAIEDAVAVWAALLVEEHQAGLVGVAGDSAGGGLCLALMLSLRARAITLPARACLFSPWTDLAMTGHSITANVWRDAMFWAPGLHAAARGYLGAMPADNPFASPLYADLTGLPPLLIHAGQREMLRDDSIRLAERARAAGLSVTLRLWPVVPHVWQLAGFVPEAGESMREAGGFLRQ